MSRLRKLEAVVFDMDGLMLDTEPIYKAAWQRASLELGYELTDTFYKTLTGRPTGDCERALVAELGVSFPMAAFRSRWSELWHEQIQEGVPRKPGLLELLSFLDARNVPTAVATSSDARYTGVSLRHAGLDGRFKVVVTGDEIARGKPAPDIYLEAAHRLGVEPAGCVALEDSEAGIRAASDAGMIAIMIPETAPSPGALRAAFQVVQSLDEARAIIATLVVT